MIVGMMWQFVVSLAVLRHELGGLHWPTLKSGSGSICRAVRALADHERCCSCGHCRPSQPMAWAYIWPPGWMLRGPTGYQPSTSPRANAQALADPQFQGQWWILGMALTSMIFNYILGEELLFRGVLLPRMAGVFGRWDWVANTVLFGLYHVHKIWAWPSMIAGSFGIAWAARRYRSFWMGVIVHGLEGFFIVLLVAVLAGWYP